MHTYSVFVLLTFIPLLSSALLHLFSSYSAFSLVLFTSTLFPKIIRTFHIVWHNVINVYCVHIYKAVFFHTMNLSVGHVSNYYLQDNIKTYA